MFLDPSQKMDLMMDLAMDDQAKQLRKSDFPRSQTEAIGSQTRRRNVILCDSCHHSHFRSTGAYCFIDSRA